MHACWGARGGGRYAFMGTQAGWVGLFKHLYESALSVHPGTKIPHHTRKSNRHHSHLPFLSDTLPNHPTPLYLKLIHAARQEQKQTDHGELGGDLLLFTVQRLDLFLQLLTGQLRQFQGLVQTCHGTAQVSITIQQGIPLYSNNILVQT